MGRGCVAEDTVEGYLSRLCEQPVCPVTGLLIGQSSVQKNYVIMATRTPPREDSPAASRNSVDKEWVTEHARQVSRMLPGGLSVLGVFIIDDNDAKDTVTTLQHLVFAVENLISSEQLWIPSDDDITDRIALHINPKTRKIVCRTLDVRDQKSTAKPADWKYNSGVCSSWSTVSCCVNVDMMVPLPDNRTSTESLSKDLKEQLKPWADQIGSAACLIDGKMFPEDAELTAGQKRNVTQGFTAQLLISSDVRSSAVAQPCGGNMSVRGAVHSTVLLHNNKPKAKLAEKLLKRDVVSTVATRVQMLLEELLMSEEEGKGKKETEQFCLPRRVYCPVSVSGPVSVCDYQFSDEDLSEVTDRLKEMLDIDVAEEDLDNMQETPSELPRRDVVTEPAPAPVETAEAPQPARNHFLGIVMASAVALLATAASMLYINDV